MNNTWPTCQFRHSDIQDCFLWQVLYSTSSYYIIGKNHIIFIVVISVADSKSVYYIIIRWRPLLYSFDIKTEACYIAVINSKHWYQDLHSSSTRYTLKMCWKQCDDDLDNDDPTNNPNNNFHYILLMIVSILPAVIGTHKEQYLFSDNITTNTEQPPTVLKTMSTVSPSSAFPYKKLGKRKELCLQRQQFWAFMQKLQYSRIGSSCARFKWIMAILYKISMTIWTLWQFHNDSVCSSTSAW